MEFFLSLLQFSQTRLLIENDGGEDVQLRGQRKYKLQKNGGGKENCWTALRGLPEVLGDEIKVKVVSVIAFFSCHIQMHGR